MGSKIQLLAINSLKSLHVPRQHICHVQNILTTTSLEVGWEQNIISIYFELRRNTVSEMILWMPAATPTRLVDLMATSIHAEI